MKRFYGVLGTVAVVALMAGCTPVTAALGVGAAAGVAAAQEGGIKTAVTDKSIYVKINDLWLRDSVDMFRKLTLTVKEGRVLVAGSVPYPDQRVRAIQLAWQAEGVQQVINEIQVDGEGGGVTDYIKDTWVSGNIKTKITFDREIQSINYTIDTVNGTVYIMGVAQNRAELDRVLYAARTTKYVKNVVSYARLRGEQPPGVQAPTGAPDSSSAAPYRDMAPAAGSYEGTNYAPRPQGIQVTSAPPSSYGGGYDAPVSNGYAGSTSSGYAGSASSGYAGSASGGYAGSAYGGSASPAPVQAESLGPPGY